MKRSIETSKPKRKKIVPPSPRPYSFFAYNPDTKRTYFEDFFATHKTYADEKRISDSVADICKTTKTPCESTPILEKFFADDLLSAARAGNAKAIRMMNQLLPGSILEDEAIRKHIGERTAIGDKTWLQEIYSPKKRKGQKYSFTLPHLELFIGMYEDVVFLRELRDKLNAAISHNSVIAGHSFYLRLCKQQNLDPNKQNHNFDGMAIILNKIQWLNESAKIHSDWFDAIFNDKRFNRVIDRVEFIYGEITGWKFIRKNLSKYLNMAVIRARVKYASEEAAVTAAAWIRSTPEKLKNTVDTF